MNTCIHPLLKDEDGLPCIVTGIGIQDNQCHIQRKEGYPLHQLIFSTHGSGTLIVNQQAYSLQEGDYFYLKPNEPHEYHGTTPQWSTNWLLFKGHQIETLLRTLGFDESRVGTFKINDPIDMLFREILLTLNTNHPFSTFNASSQLYRLLILLHNTFNHPLLKDKKHNQEIIEPTITYINTYYNDPLTLDTLAQEVGVTPQHLCKVFKESLDIRPFEYITRRRIQEAKALLLNTHLPIKEIAESVGYKDTSYFCAIFKKHELTSPSQYRGTMLSRH